MTRKLTPDEEFDRIRNGCGIGCGALLVITLLLAGATNACSSGSSGGGGGGETRSDCRSRWEGVGDGSVDWRAICDVK
ncbi:hypothetical protein [Streptomyces sp. NPDC054958]